MYIQKAPVSWLFWILISSVVVACGFSAYRYIIQEDYTFLVEAPCNPLNQACYVRDCEDYCPPNELSEYRLFSLPAKEFARCEDNSCLNICPSATYSCEEILCEEDEETACPGPLGFSFLNSIEESSLEEILPNDESE